MLYGLTDNDSKANTPDWYGTDVVRGLLANKGMLMSMCEVVGWKPLDVGGWLTVLEVVSYGDTRPDMFMLGMWRAWSVRRCQRPAC